MKFKYLTHMALCMLLLAQLPACAKKEGGEQAPAPVATRGSVPESPKAEMPEVSAPASASRAKMAAKPATLPAERMKVQARAESSSEETPNVLKLYSSAADYADGERKFVRNASANFRVKDVYKSALAIEDAVERFGGFVVDNEISSNVQESQRRPTGAGKILELAQYTVHGDLTVRVPSAKTQEFLRAIVGQIEFLDRRQFSARDVRIDMLREQLAYRRDQETQEELGLANREGGRLPQKMEAIQMRNEARAARDNARVAQSEFEDQVAFSTVRMSIYQLPELRQAELVDVDAALRKNRPDFATRAGDALSAGWERTLDLILQLVELWPLWLILPLAAAIYRRFRKTLRASD